MKQFDDDPVLMLRLLRSAYWFDEGLRKSRAMAGRNPITRTQGMVIVNVVLGVQKPRMIAQSLGISRQAVSQLIADLVQTGVLRTHPDPDDGRGLIVSLAPGSEVEGAETIRFLRAMEDELATAIGPDRIAVLRHALMMDWGEPPCIANTDAETTKALWAK